MRRLTGLIALLLLASVCEVEAARLPQLEGAWRFQKAVDTRADGSIVTATAGKEYEGFAIYTADGFVSIILMPKGRTWTIEAASLPELRDTVEAGSAYFGRYEVDEARHVLTHLPEADLSRLYIGRREERHYQLEGDQLILRETWTQSGKQWSGVRVFQRLK